MLVDLESAVWDVFWGHPTPSSGVGFEHGCPETRVTINYEMVASFVQRQVNVMWWCALGNAVCAMPVNFLLGGPSDWLRWGAYVALVAVSFLMSRRNIGLGVLTHLLGAIGLLVWLILDSAGFAARVQIGLLGFGMMLTPILIGLSVFVGLIGTISGGLIGWISLAALIVMGGQDAGTGVFVAFQIAFVSMTGFGIHRLLTSLEEARQTLERVALTDDLTGLGNRRALMVEFDRYASIAARQGVLLIVTSWDVNDLKRINDSMGHAIGDAYLQRFVRALQGTARLEDAFFRVGGDEFVGLHLGLQDGDDLISRVRVQFVGVAAGWALGMNGLEVALIEADRSMYLNKARLKSGQPEPFAVTRRIVS